MGPSASPRPRSAPVGRGLVFCSVGQTSSCAARECCTRAATASSKGLLPARRLAEDPQPETRRKNGSSERRPFAILRCSHRCVWEIHPSRSRCAERFRRSNPTRKRGLLAQLVEQLTLNQLVIGSSPIRPTTFPRNNKTLRSSPEIVRLDVRLGATPVLQRGVLASAISLRPIARPIQ